MVSTTKAGVHAALYTLTIDGANVGSMDGSGVGRCVGV
jgi:hypothetical protein